jgi:hypothetical protein
VRANSVNFDVSDLLAFKLFIIFLHLPIIKITQKYLLKIYFSFSNSQNLYHREQAGL